MTEYVVGDKQLYLNADINFYEPMGRYRPVLGDFHDIAIRVMPAGWTIERHNLWWQCTPESADIPPQGWKIHLSATIANSAAVLSTVARILFRDGVAFKFLLDRITLMSANGKRWSRGSAGKFMTVYPRDEAQCGRLLEELHAATIGYAGPYILSDRRYRDSKVVHYRYGGLQAMKRLDASGRATHVIRDEDGGFVEDERTPFFNLPKGMIDPFEMPLTSQDVQQEPGTLKNGRYKVEKLFTVSNSGGVYLALDRESGQKVVIKEARPYTNASFRGLDAVQLLKKEHRILGIIADTGIAPKPIDFFIDWEHSYLVEEYLEGSVMLRPVLANLTLLLRTDPTPEDSRVFYRRYRDLFIRIADIVRVLHARNIVFSDLSMANVMIFEDGEEIADVKLIDFEGAYEDGIDLPSHVLTPGFSPNEAIERGMATREDDYFAIGSLMMAGLFPMNSLMMINRTAYESYLESCKRDIDLPESIVSLIRSLLQPDSGIRPGPEEIIRVLREPYQPKPPLIGTHQLDAVDLDEVIDSTLAFIEHHADYARKDRLYPADPAVFETNPLSIAHGALGVAYVFHKIRGSVDPRLMDWMRGLELNANQIPPGLYIGMSGMAWALLEIGYPEQALKLLAATENHPLLWQSADVFSGAAGWGMAQLRFHQETGNAKHLDLACEAGEFLIRTRRLDDGAGCYWSTPDGISASYAHGAAGVAQFLLYLKLATGRESYLETGREALEWVVGKGFKNRDGGLTWFARDRTPSHTPYWRWGSSGIGRVMLRYWQATGERRYASLVEEIQIGCNHKYTIFPGYFFGTSGIGELYMDMARYPQWEAMALQRMRKLLSGCMLFPMRRPAGLAFPGESLSRISCDFGTGGAGIALMMHRYRARTGLSRVGSLMIDLLPPMPPRRRSNAWRMKSDGRAGVVSRRSASDAGGCA
jgi:serine/threonine protein kinase